MEQQDCLWVLVNWFLVVPSINVKTPQKTELQVDIDGWGH